MMIGIFDTFFSCTMFVYTIRPEDVCLVDVRAFTGVMTVGVMGAQTTGFFSEHDTYINS